VFGEAAPPAFASPSHGAGASTAAAGQSARTIADSAAAGGDAESTFRRLDFRSPASDARDDLAQVDCATQARVPSSPSPLDRAILGDSPTFLSRRWRDTSNGSVDHIEEAEVSHVIIDSAHSTPALVYDPQDSTVEVPRVLGSKRCAFIEHEDVKYRFRIPDGHCPGSRIVVELAEPPEAAALDWSPRGPPSWSRCDALMLAPSLRSPGATPGSVSAGPGGEAIGADILDNYH